MSMSRKHFEALAGMVREFHDYDDVRELGPDWWAAKLADFCGSDSGTFNRVRFLEACKPGCTYPVPEPSIVERARAAEDSATVADVAGSASWWTPTYEAVCVEGSWRVNEYWPGSTLVRRYTPFGAGDWSRVNCAEAVVNLRSGSDGYVWQVGISADFWREPASSERFVLASCRVVDTWADLGMVLGVLDRDTMRISHWGYTSPGINSISDTEMAICFRESRESGEPADFIWSNVRDDSPVVLHDDRVLSSE